MHQVIPAGQPPAKPIPPCLQHELDLNQQILKNIMLLFEGDTEINHYYWTKMYRLMQQHPRYRSRSNRFPDELFQEGLNTAWAEFNQEKIKTLLSQLEAQGMEITLENSTEVVNTLVSYFNRMAHNKTVDIWRKESYRVA